MKGAAELLSRIDGVRPFEYNSIRYKIEKHRETNYWFTRYASKIHGEFGMREAAFRDDMKPVVERLSIITLDGNKIKNTDRTITESGPQWTSSHSGTSMDQHTSAVQLEYSSAMKEEVCFSELEKDVKFKDLELVFKQMKEEREIALGRSVTIQEEFNLRDKYYKQRSITNFEHSMDSDLEGISKFLDYCPIIGGVKQTLEGIIGTTLSGELINDLEAKNMVVMGIFSTGIDLIPLGSILKSCNTVKSLVVSVTKDIVTSEAIGYTNSFMASCGAPPSSLIIMNLLATSVFTHYNKVSRIKDLDLTSPKVNSTNIDYIDDAFSGKTKSMICDSNDVCPIEIVGINEFDKKANKEQMVKEINDGFQSNKAASGTDVIVNVKLSKRKYPESTKHIEDAIKSGQPDTLTINRGGAKANRKASLKGIDKVPGADLDEYPPAMFVEGGNGASVRPINPSDNRGSGSRIGHQLKEYPDGTKIIISLIE
ncbi:MAG: NucA/NucB deoxyribonuclease domain-containing protein [Erysipelotrichaceae bacterium]